MNREEEDGHVRIFGNLEWTEYLTEEEAEQKWPDAACTICRHKLSEEEMEKSPNCPGCGARERTRSLVVVDHYVGKMIERIIDGELLAFALTKREREIIDHNYQEILSVSLFGSYGEGHETGVDVRDLSRYEEGRFCGSFSSLLFDYFEEHDKALSELNRVITPGGVFITHVSSGRFSDKYNSPTEVSRVTANPQKKNMQYLGEESIPHVMFTKEWLFNAIGRNGFQPGTISVRDTITGNYLHWYIGIKN
jgi:SAM-dependent methyltransferase